MGNATDKFKSELGRRNADTYISSEKTVLKIMQETPKEKRYVVAHELLRAGAEQAKQEGDNCMMLTVIPAIAKAYPQDKGIIDMCVKAAEHYDDAGLRAAILLIHNPDDKEAAKALLSAMNRTSKSDPDMNALHDRNAGQWKFLHTVTGHDLVLDTISRNANDKVIANKACQIMHNFRDIADPVRAEWTSAIAQANPGNKQAINMAFDQANKTPWWSGNLQILSAIARANQNDAEVLDKIRTIAEHTTCGSLPITYEYRGKLLALTCPLDEKMSGKLITMAHKSTNDAKIDIFSAVLAANPNNEEIAAKILHGPFSYSGIGYNTGYTVSEVFSKVLEANPNNEYIRDLAVKKAKAIALDPKVQGKSFIAEAIEKWTSKDGTAKTKTKAKTDTSRQ